MAVGFLKFFQEYGREGLFHDDGRSCRSSALFFYFFFFVVKEHDKSGNRSCQCQQHYSFIVGQSDMHTHMAPDYTPGLACRQQAVKNLMRFHDYVACYSQVDVT